MSKKSKFKKLSLLTDREKEVLYYISQSYKNKQIAKTLFICVKTVEKHKQNMIKKLKLKNTAQLIIYSGLNFLNVLLFITAFLPEDIF